MCCETCGNVFTIVTAEVGKNGRGRFCCRKCKGRAQSKTRTGKNNPRWNGGTSFEPYPSTFTKEFKRKIRQRDKCLCAICNKPARSVHHINYVKDDTTPDNCITLCRKCHGKTGANREYWQTVLSETAQERISEVKC